MHSVKKRFSCFSVVSMVSLVVVILVALFAGPLTPVSISAAPITILNPGFEASPATSGTFQVIPLANWVPYDATPVGDNTGFFLGSINPVGTTFFTAPNAVPQGNDAAIVYIDVATRANSAAYGLSQTLAATLQLNTTYTLSAQVGNIASGSGTSGNTSFYDLSGFPGYAIQLLADGILLAESTQVTADVAGIDPLPIAEGQFEQRTAVANIGASHNQVGQPLEIRLINLNTLDGDLSLVPRGLEVDFDDVQLNAEPIPEPASAILTIIGLLCLLRRPPKPTQFNRSA